MRSVLTLAFLVLFAGHSIAQKKTTLGLNLNKDATYYQIMTSTLTITQSVQEQDIKINMTVTAKTSFKVKAIMNGVYDMDVQYENLSMRMSMPAGTMEFSSDKRDDSDVFSKILALMLNKPFQVKMSKTGKIQEVKNSEGLFTGVFEQFTQLPDSQKDQIKSQLLQAYGDKAFKGNIEMMSAIFPETPVAKGDTWQIKSQFESGMAAIMQSAYQLVDVTDTFAQINGNSTLETANKDAYVESNGMPIRYDMKGPVTSEIKVDKKTGWIVEGKIHQKMEGTAYVKDNPKIPGGMTIPMSMIGDMVVTEK